MAKKGISTKDFIEKAIKLHKGKYIYNKVDCEHKNEKGKVCITCPTHGDFWQTPSDHLHLKGCKECAIEEAKKKYTLTTDEFIKKAKKIHGDKYTYKHVQYVNSHTPVLITCPIHGDFPQEPSNHLQGKGCKYCAGKDMGTEEFIRKAKLVHGDKYDYSKVKYINNRSAVQIICPEHGEFQQTPNDHLNGKGCYWCGLETQIAKRTMSQEEFIKISSEVHNGKYDYSQVEYVNAKIPVKIICPIHGSFKQIPYLHTHGCGCSACTNGQSQEELELYQYIVSLIGENNVIRNDRKILERNEIDILIPSLKVGFEYDGLFWHSELQGKGKYYHLEKTKLAESKGYHLIHIFEDEWLEHKEIVKNKIKHLLHKNIVPSIGGRKCEIREIEMNKAKKFLEQYHIQGYAPSSCYIGTFYEDELVGVMSFLKEKVNYWNLTRFVTCNKYILPGVASKMFTYFIRKYQPLEVKSFLDRRWGNNGANVYSKLGFILDKTEKPDYSYIKGNKRFHKFGFRKQILHKKYGLPLNMTESEMVQKLGYSKIWNCGLYKYVWKNSQQN